MTTAIDKTWQVRLAGIFFLAAFLAYGFGMNLAVGSRGLKLFAGVGLMLLNSLIVAAIGTLLFDALQRVRPWVAWIYQIARFGEAALLGMGAVFLLKAGLRENMLVYNLGMAVLAVGSLFFCGLLYRTRMAPRVIAAWGFIGYTLLLAGIVAEFFGLPYGIILSLPGGFFELVFGVWLIVKGLRTT